MTARINVTLPWPPAECSKNSRAHWAKRHAAFQKHKLIAVNAIHEHLFWKKLLPTGYFQLGAPLKCYYEFCPPDGYRKRDSDNFIARCAPYIDGICEALGIDDSQLRSGGWDWGGVTDGGQVIITIEAIGA